METRKRLAKLSELSYMKTACRMRAAMQIADAMAAKSISKKELADMMGRRPSEITKWLSGDQNFTSDLMAELSFYLGRPITGENQIIEYSYYSQSFGIDIVVDSCSRKESYGIVNRSRWKPITGSTIGALPVNYS